MSELAVAYDLSSKDRNNPYSLVSKMPSVIAERFLVIPNEILELSDSELKTKAKIDLELERLRVSFWTEFDRSDRTETPMNVNNIVSGVCAPTYFTKHILVNSFKLAYICRPPSNIAIAAEELLLFSMEQVREIMALPHTDEKGRVDARLAKVKIDAFREIYNRVKGMVVQRVEQKNLNVNVNQQSVAQPKSVDEINQRLAELEKSTVLELDVTPQLEVASEQQEEK